MSTFAEDLAKEHDFNTKEEYFDYIIDSLTNGQRSQVKSLFNAMHKDSQQDFLINYLDVKTGIQKSVLNICIIELTN